MSVTLYLLRQQPDRISPALFRASDTDMDIVFIEHATSIASSVVREASVGTEGMMMSDSHQMVTYDDLVEKIFSSDHIIVI